MQNLRLGQLVQTRTIYDATTESETFNNEIQTAFTRYLNGDFGELDTEDIISNLTAIIEGDRIVAKYETSKGDVYIITEADREYTTVLFADEY